jgi:pimeloyl-ACP methyl ester carboxylesterase
MQVSEQPRALTHPIGDVELPYLIYEGGGQTVILQHATGFLPWLWHPIARQLSTDHTLVAPYFCDHRLADLDKGGQSWAKLAEDLHHLIKGLDIKSPIMVGHSMGATVITLTESLYGPLAAGLVLIEPIFYPPDYYKLSARLENHPLAVKSLRRRRSWQDREDARAYLKSKALFARWDEEMLDLYLNHGIVEKQAGGGLELTCSPEEEAAIFLGSLLKDPWPMLEKITCPVLVLEGGKSDNRTFIDLKKAAATFPNGTYQLIEDAGHLIPMEQPRKIIAIIREFIGALAE